ncbi:portal protein [Lactobacillus sp. PFC-70]|uniref:phage portal protein n=1 Tax=Levilactobacillus namurensis TaxID=380393 RepID=UPI000D3038E9|nr:phage portal protein [Levilactobacillus namurensis]PTM24127.1 portal protein [Lactobacillus sp. PFC-70]HJE44456.1 phage portal protein [Levilactobacillus namurensis]
MEIKVMKELLKKTDSRRAKFNAQFDASVRYYFNKNDITNRNNGESRVKKDGSDKPLRRADNRVSNNFHQLLVDQEAGYLATIPPSVDVEDDGLNDTLKQTLGDNFGLRLNQLVVDAANAGVAWVHYWTDKDGQFRYGIVPPDQVTPIYSNDLDRKLLAVRRTYSQLDPRTGKNYRIHEYWTDTDCTFFRSQKSDYSDLEPLPGRFTIWDVATQEDVGTGTVMKHNFGRIPFIAFPKNKYQRPELYKYKGLIDVYDDVYNGFVNDIDDVQQVILILTNYGGTDLSEFMETLKKGVIKMDSSGANDKSGVDKLTIDIPVEARTTLLESTKADIFVHGQGIDPTKFEATNASGTAIKMLYSHLELKAANTQAYFTDALNELIRAIMRWAKASDPDGRKIEQTWSRTSIHNNLEEAQTLSQVAQYSSDEAIAKANPLVDDWQQELKDRQDDIVKHDGYDNPEALNNVDGEDDDEA